MNFHIRKPDITRAEFRDHYENSHVPLALKSFPQIVEHRRNYPCEGGAFFPEGVSQPWDCVAEIWFEDRRYFDTMMNFLSDAVASTEITKDGAAFLDGAKCGMLLVDEMVTHPQRSEAV